MHGSMEGTAGGRGTAKPDPRGPRVALLIDAENVSGTSPEAFVLVAKRYGVLAASRAYADWSSSAVAGFRRAARTADVELVQATHYVSGKNTSDIVLAIDAMEIALTGGAEILVVASHDSDFRPLAHRLRARGIRVVLVTVEGHQGGFAVGFDDVVEIGGGRERGEAASAAGNPERNPVELLLEASGKCQEAREGGWRAATDLGEKLGGMRREVMSKIGGKKLVHVLRNSGAFELADEGEGVWLCRPAPPAAEAAKASAARTPAAKTGRRGALEGELPAFLTAGTAPKAKTRASATPTQTAGKRRTAAAR